MGQGTGASAPSPRAVLLAALFDGARAAVVAGDLDAARVAHEAIGKLLGATPPPMQIAVNLASPSG